MGPDNAGTGRWNSKVFGKEWVSDGHGAQVITPNASRFGWRFHVLSSGGAFPLASGTAGWLVLAPCRSRPTVWHGVGVETVRVSSKKV